MEPSPFAPGNPERPSLRYVFLRFLRLGGLAWGGPVAQIGMMHRELVERDGWVDETRFRKVLALYQALPGPEALELAVYFGMLKRGRAGGALAGLAFMLPGVVLLTLLAALYTATAETSRVGTLLLHGVRPAVLALVAWGLFRLARRSLPTLGLASVAVAAAVVGLVAPQVSFLIVLAAGGAATLAFAALAAPRRAAVLLPIAFLAPVAFGTLGAVAWVSAKAGLLSFGGAYTAIPFLREGAVDAHGWTTDAGFLDAFALAGLVPAPLIAVGTFVGYLAAGLPGALVATVCIFAPAFAFTLAGHDAMERIVDEPRLHAFLLGVTAAVLGLVLVATVPLARAALVDAWTAGIALAAFAAFLWGRLPVPVVLAASALAGLAVRGWT